MARIVILTAGSRGDVQPYVALGRGLQAGGHSVLVATHAIFGDWIRQSGLEYQAIEGNPLEIIQGERGQAWVGTGTKGLRFASGFRELMGPVLAQATADAMRICTDADLLLVSGVGFYVGYNVAEKLGLPYLQAYLQPVTPTRAFPSALFNTRLRGAGAVNYGTHAVGGQIFWQLLRPMMNRIRREVLDLPPLSLFGPFLDMQRANVPVIHGYSPTILPKPADWNPAHFVTGFWFLDDDEWTPDEALTDFLAAGPPPVYVGFGSMTSGDPVRLTDTVLEALAVATRRGIILGGWAGLADRALPDEVLRLESAPHSWLFPRMAAVVHHGGVGTTHEGVRAGVPSVMVPFFADQPFWARRAHELGIAPRPVPQAALTAPRLAAAIAGATESSAIAEAAAAAGRAVRQEHGVANAVAIVDRYLRQKPGFSAGLLTS